MISFQNDYNRPMEILGAISLFSSPHWFYPTGLQEERGKRSRKTERQKPDSLLQPTEKPL